MKNIDFAKGGIVNKKGLTFSEEFIQREGEYIIPREEWRKLTYKGKNKTIPSLNDCRVKRDEEYDN